MDKGKKACYIVKEESNDEFKDHDGEVFYILMKYDFDEDKETTTISTLR